MKTHLHLWGLLLALVPLGALAQKPSPRETIDPLPFNTKEVKYNKVTASPITANGVAATCAVSTTLDFAQSTNGEDWKNHAAVVVGASPRNTTIETAGTYLEPTGGAETTLNVQANTTNNLKVANLYWYTNYTNKNNSTTQITYSFNRPVNNFSLTLLDVDRNNSNFIDAVTLDAYQADGSILKLGTASEATVANNTAYTSVDGNTITGNQQNVDGESNGTVTVTFNKPITRFVITYRNTYNIADPGVQYIGITSMSWCTQANVATTLTGPARALPGAQVTYTVSTTANGDYAASGVQPVVQLSPGLNSQSPVFPAGSSYNNTTGLLTLATIATLNTGTTNTSTIRFNMPGSTVTGKASSTIDTDDSDPSDNNGSIAAANVTTTTNQAPVAQAKSATVSVSTTAFIELPALTGTDPDSDPLTYRITGITGINFGKLYYTNGTTRTQITGAIDLTAAQAATLEFQNVSGALNTSGSFTYTVSDSYGGTSPAVNYTLTVANQQAVYSSPNVYYTTTITNGKVLATVSDPDGSIITTTFTQTSGTTIKGITFSADGTATAVEKTTGAQADRFPLPGAGTYVFSVTTTDNRNGQTTSSVTIKIVNSDTEAAYSTTNQFNRDALTSGKTLATVNDPDAPLTAATLATGSVLPSGMSFNSPSGQFTVGSTAPFAGTYTYTVNTTDAAGGSSTPAVTITVFDDTEATYTVAATPTGAYTNNQSLATVSDVDGAITNATLVSSAALPSGVGLNSTTGQFTVTDRMLLKAGSYPIQVTTKDATGGLTAQTITIIIRNNPTLPVQLANFAAKAVGQSAQLTWRTAQELDNDHFVIERSFDGKSFTSVGQVKGQGTTSVVTDYRFTDAQAGQQAQGQVAYYRLRQVDTDGTTSYSSVQALTFSATAAISVKPNPASGQASLELGTMPVGQYQVTALDVTGRLVYQAPAQGGQAKALPVGQWPAGVYLIRVQGQNTIKTTRLVKE